MKWCVIVNTGLVDLAQKEIKELIGVEGSIIGDVVTFSCSVEKILTIIHHAQSVRKVCAFVGEYTSLEDVQVDFQWSDFFTSELSFKVDVDNVQGQENRLDIARQVAGVIFAETKKHDITPRLELKKPDFLWTVHHTGDTYIFGIDLTGVELDKRQYRVFAHQASFRGDFAYYFLRKSGFVPGKKFLSGFMKDGTVSIEAALFSGRKPVHDTSLFSYRKFPVFADVTSQSLPSSESEIHAFDETTQNLTAARKNCTIAGVKDTVSLHKYALEDLDVKFDKESFDTIVVHLTTKDESRLQEVLYQIDYILKSPGTFLLITRQDVDVSFPSSFSKMEEGTLQKGTSIHKFFVAQK